MTQKNKPIWIGSSYEHDCSFVQCDYTAKNLSELKELLIKYEDCSKIVTWMYICNMTGEIFPVQEIGKLCHEYNAIFVCDFTAGLHNEPVPDNIDDWCDIAIWSGAKVGAEKGTGGIWFSDRAWKVHCIGNESPLHFGTPNVAQAMAQAQAMEHCQNKLNSRVGDGSGWTGRYIESKWDKLWVRLMKGIRKIRNDYDDITQAFHWGNFDFTLGITGLYLPDINADAFQQFASTKQVYFSVFHSACAGQGDYRVAEAYGLTKEQASHCIRLSFGYETNEQDIDRFIEVLKEFREMFCSDGVCKAKKELAGRGIPVGLSK